MKQITIAEQPWLGLARTVRITVDGIRYRLFRASVTVAVIAVAVAFLMNILSESLIKRSVATDTRDRIRRMRMVYDWSARLTVPGSLESIIADVAKAPKDGPFYTEVRGMSGMGEAEMTDFHEAARKATVYLNFFNDLDYAKRRNLIRTASGVEIFRRLRTEAGLEQFRTELAHILSVRFPTPQPDLDAFLAEWPKLEASVRTVLAGRRKAIAGLTADLGQRTILEGLSDSETTFGDTIRARGFVFDAETVAPVVADQAKRLLDVLRLEKSMEQKETRQLISQEANVLPADVNVLMMWKYLDNRKFAARYIDKMSESGLDVMGLTAERLVELADARDETEDLLKAERLTVDAGRGFMGLGERLAWLLFVSMLVCGIGICNAMLMTVTERFTEIATLKCLGALDGFIMIMFVLESCVLGIVGGVIGAILGALIGLGRMLVAFGINFIGAIPAGDMVLGILASVLIGMFLAAIAAVLPSFKAARLAPMEAMRIE